MRDGTTCGERRHLISFAALGFHESVDHDQRFALDLPRTVFKNLFEQDGPDELGIEGACRFNECVKLVLRRNGARAPVRAELQNLTALIITILVSTPSSTRNGRERCVRRGCS